jgi:cobalamin biosynthesis protein CbiG
MYIFSCKWNNLDVQGVKSKAVGGILSTNSEEEAILLRQNSSFIEVTQAFQPREEPKAKEEILEVPEEPKVDEALKTIEVMRKKKPKIVVGARLVQEEKE